MTFSNAGRMSLTLTRLNLRGEIKAGDPQGITIGQFDNRTPGNAPDKKRAALRRLEGQQGGVKQSRQEPLDIQKNWMMRFIIWNL